MKSRHMRTALLTVLLAAATAAAQPTVGHYQEFGDARGFLNIVPPGPGRRR